MKFQFNFIASISVLFFLMGSTQSGFSNSLPNPAPAKEVYVNLNGVFIPSGFDSTSNVHVVINGIFPNGCYQFLRVDPTSTAQGIIEIRTVARVQQNMCISVLIPFTREVNLGQFSRGKHTIRFISSDGTYFDEILEIE